MTDINTASADEIDPVTALKGHGFEIVRYRKERDRFDQLRQLEEVPGLARKVAGLEGAGGLNGGWITASVTGPFKGVSGSRSW